MSVEFYLNCPQVGYTLRKQTEKNAIPLRGFQKISTKFQRKLASDPLSKVTKHTSKQSIMSENQHKQQTAEEDLDVENNRHKKYLNLIHLNEIHRKK